MKHTKVNLRVNGRRMVTIDPEDREQVERLFSLWKGHPLDGLQQALRDFIADPKPDEPQGLGAVVEDANGDLWVRVAVGGVGWIECNHMTALDDGDAGRSYKRIAAVRVLSEGVTSKGGE